MPHFVPFVQAIAEFTGSGLATFSLPYASTNTAGSYLLAVAYVSVGSITVTGVSDVHNGSWTQIAGPLSTTGGVGSDLTCYVFRIASNTYSAGALSVVAALSTSGASTIGLSLYEFTGQSGTTPETAIVTTALEATPTAAINPVTTTLSNQEVIILGINADERAVSSSANSFTQATYSTNFGNIAFCEFQGEAIPGSYGDTITFGGNTDLAAFAIAVTSTSSAAPGGTYQIDDYGQGISFR
jgi:hypothetical protein